MSARFQRSGLILALVSGALAAAEPNFSPDDAGHQQTIVPFLQRHCLKCHGPDKQKADFRVDRDLPNDFFTRSVAQKWSEVLNKLDTGEMPPKEEPRSASNDVAQVSQWILRERLRGEQARKGTAVVMRRLNRAEYNNTVRDLAGVDIQPADEFPADPPAGGFDNNGDALSISPLHLELYVKAAQRVVDRAIVRENARPPNIKWRFELEEGSKDNALNTYRRNFDGQSIYINGGNNVTNGMTVLRGKSGDGLVQVHSFKVPQAGYYTIRMRAAGLVPAREAVLRAAKELHQQAQRRQDNARRHFHGRSCWLIGSNWKGPSTTTGRRLRIDASSLSRQTEAKMKRLTLKTCWQTSCAARTAAHWRRAKLIRSWRSFARCGPIALPLKKQSRHP